MTHPERLVRLQSILDAITALGTTLAETWPDTMEERTAIRKTIVSIADAHNLLERAGNKVRVAMRHLNQEAGL